MIGDYLGAVLEDDSYDLDYKLDFVQSYIEDFTNSVYSYHMLLKIGHSTFFGCPS